MSVGTLTAGSWTALQSAVGAAAPTRVGIVTSVLGLGLDIAGLSCPLGTVVGIGPDRVPAEVVAARSSGLHCMPLGSLDGITVGDEAHAGSGPALVPVGSGLLGRVIDGLGRPLDGKGPLGPHALVQLDRDPPSPLERRRITTPLQLGVRVMDTLTAVGSGQRIGLFAGSGVGKSSLLSMIARGTDAQVNVIALVGERGREVREFLEEDLGPEGLARSIVVVSTSDEPARMRLRAAFVATRIAEEFRAGGAEALLMMDSLTRVAMAQREIGLSAGEPPATRGYPPSTFSLLARLLERAGTSAEGSITGIYTVLVDGDDHNEPIADSARSLLDGHIVLDRKLAVAGHFPSIDALASVSRVASKVTTGPQRAAASTLRRVMAARASAQDLLDVGAYQRGVNPLVDAAVDNQDAISAFLCQRLDEPMPASGSWAHLDALLHGLGVC
ncbi:FliI/YscN family ATPase [Paeniglutamicibacter cryotolerans]|uniref:Flagellum-specific ATP synthase n=1 Tax=Paeniglutamicibacter cryotolerans TaxID=670079 RepID=A0A839QHD9_9MICC|nr:FliI/YscN family ATPase [Paeniglutamicibacter cryotolerans]MBB2993895.1 flagellum-specific ATP synthase [Paeniglutamicibacter cryotolerans]